MRKPLTVLNAIVWDQDDREEAMKVLRTLIREIVLTPGEDGEAELGSHRVAGESQ